MVLVGGGLVKGGLVQSEVSLGFRVARGCPHARGRQGFWGEGAGTAGCPQGGGEEGCGQASLGRETCTLIPEPKLHAALPLFVVGAVSWISHSPSQCGRCQFPIKSGATDRLCQGHSPFPFNKWFLRPDSGFAWRAVFFSCGVTDPWLSGSIFGQVLPADHQPSKAALLSFGGGGERGLRGPGPPHCSSSGYHHCSNTTCCWFPENGGTKGDPNPKHGRCAWN